MKVNGDSYTPTPYKLSSYLFNSFIMKISHLLLLILLVSLVSVFPLISQTDSLSVEADKYYNLQDYAKALDLYEQCLVSDTSNVLLHENAAISAYRLGDVPLAKTLYQTIEKLDSTHRLALSQLATIYEQQKNTPKTILYYNKLIKLYPENSIYYRKIAQQYQSAGVITDAFKNYAKANKLNPRDLFTLKGLSEMFITNNQFVEADSTINVGLNMDTTNISLRLLIAQSKYRQKAYDSTVVHLEKIIGKLDFSPYYNKMLGYSYIQIDSFERAIPVLEKSLNDNGSKENAHYYLAIAYDKLENKEYSIFHYEKAIEEGISKNVDIYHRVLAKKYNEDNELKKAIEHYKDAYRFGNDPLVLFYLARASDVYYKDKNIAINYYTKYYKSKHDNEEYINYSKQRSKQLKELGHQKKAMN